MMEPFTQFLTTGFSACSTLHPQAKDKDPHTFMKRFEAFRKVTTLYFNED